MIYFHAYVPIDASNNTKFVNGVTNNGGFTVVVTHILSVIHPLLECPFLTHFRNIVNHPSTLAQILCSGIVTLPALILPQKAKLFDRI